MQVARLASAIANGGILWKPRLIQKVERPDGTLAYAEASKMTGQVDLSPVIWAYLRHAMSGVVNEGGTGAAARLPGLEIAGKTGTAQTVANSTREKGQDHAWLARFTPPTAKAEKGPAPACFAAFAPANDPQVVVVVLVEGGGHGGSVAAPVARQIFQAIFLEKVAMRVLAGAGSGFPGWIAAPPRTA